MEMKGRTVLHIVGANLVLLLLLTIFLPQYMIQPGRLMEAHRALETDCFACHVPFVGSRPARCIQCHKPAEIGLVTTKGVPIGNEQKLIPFHQDLIEKDCVACHSDHKGVQAFYPIARFSHNLLQAGSGERCEGCHRRPEDDLHRQIAGSCGQCHTREAWTPATFSHDLLAPGPRERCVGCHLGPEDDLHSQVGDKCGACHTEKAWTPVTFNHDRLEPRLRGRCVACHRGPGDALHRQVGDKCGACHSEKSWTPATFSHDRLEPRLRARCQTCHRRPGDTLHRQVVGNCGQCHNKKAWTPATYNHDRFFRLDRNHRATCNTCHRNSDFTRYTCYGCHAHSRSGIRAEHREEGIVQYENCVKCHRSGVAEEGEGEHEDRDEEEHEKDDD